MGRQYRFQAVGAVECNHGTNWGLRYLIVDLTNLLLDILLRPGGPWRERSTGE